MILRRPISPESPSDITDYLTEFIPPSHRPVITIPTHQSDYPYNNQTAPSWEPVHFFKTSRRMEAANILGRGTLIGVGKGFFHDQNIPIARVGLSSSSKGCYQEPGRVIEAPYDQEVHLKLKEGDENPLEIAASGIMNYLTDNLEESAKLKHDIEWAEKIEAINYSHAYSPASIIGLAAFK